LCLGVSEGRNAGRICTGTGFNVQAVARQYWLRQTRPISV
jgi:hypothetical protein